MLLLQAEEQRAVAGVELAAASVRLIEAKLQQAKAELGSANASLAATFTIAASYILALTMMPNRKAFMASYYPPH
jgi:hypothetical protein